MAETPLQEKQNQIFQEDQLLCCDGLMGKSLDFFLTKEPIWCLGFTEEGNGAKVFILKICLREENGGKTEEKRLRKRRGEINRLEKYQLRKRRRCRERRCRMRLGGEDSL